MKALIDAAGERPPHHVWALEWSPAIGRVWGLEWLPPAIGRGLLEHTRVDLDAEPRMLPTLLHYLGADDDRLSRVRALLRQPTARSDSRYLMAAARACGERTIELLPELRDCLSWPSSEWRNQVIQLIGELGPAAAPAIPDLQAAMAIPAFRLQAAIALERIGGMPLGPNRGPR